MELNGEANEYLILTYAKDDKLYVPITALHLISRYSGHDLEHAPLHQLGTDKWSKAKEKAAKRIRDTAAELLDIYAKRAAKAGFQYQAPDADYQRFCDQFPFETTEDQQAAIDAVEVDMTSTQPMDRLICVMSALVKLKSPYVPPFSLRKVANKWRYWYRPPYSPNSILIP